MSMWYWAQDAGLVLLEALPSWVVDLEEEDLRKVKDEVKQYYHIIISSPSLLVGFEERGVGDGLRRLSWENETSYTYMYTHTHTHTHTHLSTLCRCFLLLLHTSIQLLYNLVTLSASLL